MTRRKKHYFDRPLDAPKPLEHEEKRKLLFSEADPLTVAWHGNYPGFFELAHSGLMERIGLTYEKYAQNNVASPIVQLHVDYFSPLLVGEEFSIRAIMHWSDGARINVEYAITHADGSLAATGYTVQMFVDYRERKAFILPPEIYEECKRRWKAGEFEL